MNEQQSNLSQSIEDYRVNLDCYSGPLDLLLYLVKRSEIDIYDLPMKELTEQYLKHLKLIEQFNVDNAGEFLVMAATLLEVKSLMIMPAGEEGEQSEENEDEGLSESDPRYGLVQQLLAYKKFKDAAMQLDERREEWEKRFAAMPTRLTKADRKQLEAGDEAEDAKPVEIDLEDANVLDLCEAFARILESIGRNTGTHDVTYDDTPIALHAEDIYDRLQRDGSMTLQQMFEGRKSKSELIGLFMATLELVREHRVRVIQDTVKSEIKLELRPEEDARQGTDDTGHRDWKNPETGEVEYDWPSEADRKRAERRAKLRATFARKKLAAEDELDEDDLLDEEDEDAVEETSDAQAKNVETSDEDDDEDYDDDEEDFDPDEDEEDEDDEDFEDDVDDDDDEDDEDEDDDDLDDEEDEDDEK
jgi:segregation and condensation protein A